MNTLKNSTQSPRSTEANQDVHIQPLSAALFYEGLVIDLDIDAGVLEAERNEPAIIWATKTTGEMVAIGSMLVTKGVCGEEE